MKSFASTPELSMIEETKEKPATKKRTITKRKTTRTRAPRRKKTAEEEQKVEAIDTRSAEEITEAVPALAEVSIEEIKRVLAAREAAEKKAAGEQETAEIGEKPREETTDSSKTDTPKEEATVVSGENVEESRRPQETRRGRRQRRDRSERFEELQQRYEEGGGRHGSSDEPAEPESPAEPVFAEGVIEVSGKGFGFLRDAKRNFAQSPQDVFVTPEVVRKYTLRDGQWIRGEIRRGNRGLQMFRLESIEGEDPDKYIDLPHFDELTTINPNSRIKLETVPERYTTRVMDMITPVGKGQRGLIVSPPRTGKTTLLQHIADAVGKNHPEMKLIILLVDERPEEVTEIRRTVPHAEIMASSNDSDLKSHTRIAQLAIERAKRLVEAGKDVFILLDSLTRVGRAFNNAMSGGGRTLSGGMDARAMEIPRKLFAAARNTEEAGSLTIMATALIETGSRMDELIFQEFKGTGNMELVLDRKISDQRIYPAVDIFLSGTRREELLLPAHELEKINVIRRGLSGHRPVEAIERLLMFVKKFPTNSQMLREIPG